MTVNLEYTAPQIEFLFNHKDGAKFIIVPAGRRFGKTKGAANACIEWILEGKKILWGDTISGNIDRYVERYFKPAITFDYSYSSMKKVLSCELSGGYIDFRSADRPENWEGFGYDIIILNEAGIILKNDYLFTNAVLPMLMDSTGSKLIAIGTPKGKEVKSGKEHRFFSLFKRAMAGDPLDQAFSFSSYDNPFLGSEDVKELEGEIQRMNPAMVRQEIYAEFVEGAEGELWDEVIIERQRITKPPEMQRIVVAIDPAISSNAKSDETGIWIGGKSGEYGYTLGDESGKYSPEQWASVAIKQAEKWNADCIVAEKNQGGDMVESVLRSAGYNGRIKLVTATKGKFIRAEPIYSLYEQGKIFHVGYHPKLEAQMCTFSSELKNSPDRVDALVWGFTEIMLSPTMFFF